MIKPATTRPRPDVPGSLPLSIGKRVGVGGWDSELLTRLLRTAGAESMSDDAKPDRKPFLGCSKELRFYIYCGAISSAPARWFLVFLGNTTFHDTSLVSPFIHPDSKQGLSYKSLAIFFQWNFA